MFGGPIFGPDVRPANAPSQNVAMQGPAMGELSGPEGPGGASPYTFEQALSDVLDFLGMGGTEQAANNQLATEQQAESKGGSAYQPTESNHVQDREREAPDPLDTAYQRYGSNPKEAAVRLSLAPRGVVPFAASAYDVATGQNNPRNLTLSELYRKRQLEADQLEADQKPATAAVREYLPLIAGGVAGAIPGRARGVAGLTGAVLRAGGAGAVTGATEGYFDKSNDGFELDDPRRIKSAIGGAGINAAIAMPAGLAGHMATEGVRAGMDRLSGPKPSPALGGPSGPSQGPSLPIGQSASRPTGSQIRESIYERRFQADLDNVIGRQVKEGKSLAEIAKKLDMSPAELAKRVEQRNLAPPRDMRIKQEINELNPPAQPAPKPKPATLGEAAKAQTQPQAAPKAQEQPKTQQAQEAQPSKAKPPISQMDLRKWSNTKAGKSSWEDIQAGTRKAQLDADAQVMKGTYNPPSARDMLASGGKTPVKITPEAKPQAAANEVRFTRGEGKGSYTPTQRKGAMQIADEVSSTSGRSPAKWEAGDKEEFIRAAARHTNMRPAQIKALITSYGENATRAQKGLSNKRIAEIVEAERTAERLKPTKKNE